MIYLYFGMAFLLYFMKTENTVYTSIQNNTLLFINGLIFDIMNKYQGNFITKDAGQKMFISWQIYEGLIRSVS